MIDSQIKMQKKTYENQIREYHPKYKEILPPNKRDFSVKLPSIVFPDRK